MNLYHVSHKRNSQSILKRGIIPSYRKGLLSCEDNLTYLTPSLTYIKIIAEEIALWKHYTIFKVCVLKKDLKLLWWKGKGFKEWTTTKPISPDRISVFKQIKKSSI